LKDALSVLILRNVSAAFLGNVTVGVPGAENATAAQVSSVASALARAWAAAAALSAGASPGSVLLTSGPSPLAWTAVGVSPSGAVITCAVAPTPAGASGGGAPLRLALALAGSIAQPANTIVRVPAEAWAEGPAAAALYAAQRLPPPAASLLNVTAAAAAAARAILGALSGAPPVLASNFTDAAAVAAAAAAGAATPDESARGAAFAAAVRTRGVTIEGTATASEDAVASEPVGGGAMSGLAVGGSIGADSAQVVGDAYFLTMASTAIGMILTLASLYYYCRPAASAPSKNGADAHNMFQHVNPLARSAGRAPKKHPV
jgi:hypothetical protein